MRRALTCRCIDAPTAAAAWVHHNLWENIEISIYSDRQVYTHDQVVQVTLSHPLEWKGQSSNNRKGAPVRKEVEKYVGRIGGHFYTISPPLFVFISKHRI